MPWGGEPWSPNANLGGPGRGNAPFFCACGEGGGGQPGKRKGKKKKKVTKAMGGERNGSRKKFLCVQILGRTKKVGGGRKKKGGKKNYAFTFARSAIRGGECNFNTDNLREGTPMLLLLATKRGGGQEKRIDCLVSCAHHQEGDTGRGEKKRGGGMARCFSVER